MTTIYKRNKSIIFSDPDKTIKELVEENKYKLAYANLSHADLSHANLSNADLYNADLSHANLSNADLYNANLYNADLSNADLSHADLSHADLYNADLSGTVIDPNNTPNQKWKEFEEIDIDWIVGYRTRRTSAGGKTLVDNRIYGCEIFSTCEKTDCHPGWYLWPTLKQAQDFLGKYTEFIKVKTRKIDLHKTPAKYRSRMIWVIETVNI